MTAYCVSRLLGAALVMFGVLCLVFALLHLVPGDPVEVMLGEHARPADAKALRTALGLDLPLHIQFWHFFEGLLRFDLGASLHSRRPITEILAQRIPATVALAVASMVIALLIALPMGMVAAMRRDTAVDAGAVSFSVFAAAVPNFVLGPLLILVFALWLGWLPVSGRDSAFSIVLPAVTLGASLAAVLSRMVRATLIETLGQDYIRTARAKGLSEAQVVRRHALGNALLPVVTLAGLQLGVLLAGAVITEKVFDWPGIGLLLVESIQRRDYPVVQACVLLISLTYVAVNTGLDFVYAWLDPRIRLVD